MSFSKRRRPFKARRPERPVDPQALKELADPASTGTEAAYLKSLVESKKKVTVMLTSGERVRGRVRYYDHDFFSVGPTAGGPNMFLHKSGIRCIIED